MPSFTLEDIARQTGVSRSTVSRVVNNLTNVREEVRRRVLEAIEKNGYRPHAAARTLASRRSSIIGLIQFHSIDLFFTDSYYPYLAKGISQGCSQHDQTLTLFLAETTEEEKTIFPRMAHTGLLDGQNISYIDIDNVSASQRAVNHLLHLGYKRIGTIAGPSASAVGVDRLAGYRKALMAASMGVDDSLIVEGDFTEAGGYQAMQRMLSGKPDAVFAASDIMALGAIRAVREAGLSVPQDIAFVGFDDLPLALLEHAQLTTIRQPVIQFGNRAVELLLDLIEHGDKPPRQIIMDAKLVIRTSCGA